MSGDPGGRPYTGENALIGYAARFLFEHGDELKHIIDPKTPAATQRDRYLAFSKQILEEDLARMKKGLTIGRWRKNIFRFVATSLNLSASTELSAANDALTQSRDISRHTLGKPAEPRQKRPKK